MTILISHAYTRLSMKRYRNAGGSMLTALICFFVLAGAYLPDFNVDYLGPKSVFLALLTGLGRRPSTTCSIGGSGATVAGSSR